MRSKSDSAPLTTVKEQRTVMLNKTGSSYTQRLADEAPPVTIAPGSLLNNRFNILEIIGSGGMGTVYKALDKRDIEAENSRFIAIKVLNHQCQQNTTLLQSLYEETKHTQSLSHPNIVTAYDFDRDANLAYMTMELIDGAPLDQIIKRNPTGIVFSEAINMIKQIGNALAYAHSQHIIHLDLKPSNIYFDKNRQIKILDFGIAQKLNSALSDKAEPTLTMALTPSYASIELLNDDIPSTRDDIYAFACICYEILTGEHPYHRQRADTADKKQQTPEKIKTLSSTQWAALKKALALKKYQRTASIEQFLLEFNAQPSHLKWLIPTSLMTLLASLAYTQWPISQSSSIETPDTTPKMLTNILEAPSLTPETFVPEVTPVVQKPITLWTNQTHYKIGDTLTLSFEVNTALYAQLFIINSIGIITPLFPNPYQPNNLLQANTLYQIPPDHAEFTLDISAPKGHDRIIAFTHKTPFPPQTITLDATGNIIHNQSASPYQYTKISYTIE